MRCISVSILKWRVGNKVGWKSHSRATSLFPRSAQSNLQYKVTAEAQAIGVYHTKYVLYSLLGSRVRNA